MAVSVISDTILRGFAVGIDATLAPVRTANFLFICRFENDLFLIPCVYNIDGRETGKLLRSLLCIQKDDTTGNWSLVVNLL